MAQAEGDQSEAEHVVGSDSVRVVHANRDREALGEDNGKGDAGGRRRMRTHVQSLRRNLWGPLAENTPPKNLGSRSLA